MASHGTGTAAADVGIAQSEMADWAIKSFRAGLETSGYVEGRNLTVKREVGFAFNRGHR
jgi:hypothetical protein